jgi:hypothetical protein
MSDYAYISDRVRDPLVYTHLYSHKLHSTQVLRGSTLYSYTHTRIQCNRPRYYAALHCTHALILAYTALDPGTTRLYTVLMHPYSHIIYTALDPGTTRLYTVLMHSYSHTLHSIQVLRGSALYSCTHTRIHCTRPRYYAALHCTSTSMH